MVEKDAYISNESQLQIHSLNFIYRNLSLLSATSILSLSTLAQNTTASLGKPTCPDYLDFGNCQDRFGRFSRSKNDSSNLDVNLKSSSETTTETFAWFKISQWEKQISNGSYDSGISSSLQRKTLLETKTSPHC